MTGKVSNQFTRTTRQERGQERLYDTLLQIKPVADLDDVDLLGILETPSVVMQNGWIGIQSLPRPLFPLVPAGHSRKNVGKKTAPPQPYRSNRSPISMTLTCSGYSKLRAW